jgi:ribosomal protein S18 acetylase RimI-like enzyme
MSNSPSIRLSRAGLGHVVGFDDVDAGPTPQERQSRGYGRAVDIQPEVMDRDLPEVTVQPLTMDMVHAMADVMKEGFGSKRCCVCVPIGNPDEIHSYYTKHPERLPRTGLALGKDGKPLGFVQLAIYPQHDKDGLHTNKPGETYVEMVGVAAAARGKGVGKMLLQWAEDQARENHGTALTLAVLNGNPARRL